jgi:ABC-type Mn2+/Zn2+ transport system permease subunit
VAGALGIAGLSRRARNDVATALTFVMMLGVGALFVSWSTEYAQEAYSLLFGEVFGVAPDEVLPILGLGVISIAAIAVMFRPLLAMVLSVAIALVTVWVGIALSYQSNWPLGFFVGIGGAVFFLLGRAYAAARGRGLRASAAA